MEKALRRRTRMLPKLDLETVGRAIDAHVCLDEAGEENRRRPEASRNRLELPQPATGVDESTYRPKSVTHGACV
jgi:hypothetical protein